MKYKEISKQHWNKHAAKWSLVSSPLRPSGEDVEIFQSKIEQPNQPTLILGVTPELQSLSTQTYVVDNNELMLENFAGPDVKMIHSSWQDLKIKNNRIKYVFGDGSLNVIKFPDDLRDVLDNLLEQIDKNGRFAIRFFVSPDKNESVEEVLDKAYNNTINNFSAFKWHFAMALLSGDNPNIAVRDICKKFIEYVPNIREFAQKTGWDLDAIETINHYQFSDSVYNFPKLDLVKKEIEKKFKILSIDYADYYLSDRCPIICFEAF